jgi:hypothetical protein
VSRLTNNERIVVSGPHDADYFGEVSAVDVCGIEEHLPSRESSDQGWCEASLRWFSVNYRFVVEVRSVEEQTTNEQATT